MNILKSVCKKNTLQTRKGALCDTLKWHNLGGIRSLHNDDYNDDCILHILASKAILFPWPGLGWFSCMGPPGTDTSLVTSDHVTSGLIAYLWHSL